MLLVGIDFKMFTLAGSQVSYGLCRKIHFHLHLRIRINRIEKFLQETFTYHHRKHEIIQFIILMDISEETAYHYSESISCNGPSRMFTAASRTEILPRYQDFTAISRVVQHKFFVQRTIRMVSPVTEQVITKKLLFTGGRFQETCRNNLVSIHVFQRQGYTSTCYDVKFLFHTFHSVYMNSLGSVITPVMAAAAAVNGLANKVRAPGPCRPSKLRLLVDTEYLPAGILSSFIAKQAEHPG